MKKTRIRDKNFEQALIDLGHDDVLDGYVLTDNIKNITELNINSKDILDLTGIEDFKALIDLDCDGNQLTSIDMSKNKDLASLWCANNQLLSLDVSKNKALVNLWCWSNQLKSLDLRKNTALTVIFCWDNQLKNIIINNDQLQIGFGTLKMDDNVELVSELNKMRINNK